MLTLALASCLALCLALTICGYPIANLDACAQLEYSESLEIWQFPIMFARVSIDSNAQTWTVASLSLVFFFACVGERFLSWSAHPVTSLVKRRLLEAMKSRLFSLLFSFGLAEMNGIGSFSFGVSVLGSFYATIYIRIGVTKCLRLIERLSAKRHQKLFFGQLMILLVIVYGMMIAYRTLDVVGLEQVIGGLMTSALGIVLDIIAHLVFLFSPDELGNSERSYRVLFIAESVVQVLELSVSLFFMGYLLIKSQLPIFYMRQIYEYGRSVYFHYESWRTWMRMRLMIERLPVANASDLARHDICVICRSDMSVEKGRRLPCGHCFHSECIERWVGLQKSCPTCKRDLKAALESVERKRNALMQQQTSASRNPKTFRFADLMKR
jgi:E3 ubiquitin-protein ligase synoviolin